MKLDDLIKDYKEMTLDEVYVEDLLEDLHKLKDTYTPEVPQYVADWYEENKKNLDYNIWDYIMDWEYTEEDSFKRWVNNSKDAFQTIINMHQFGYKIENGKKYLVKLIQGGQYLYTDRSGETYFTAFSQSNYTKNKLEELNLEWVFDCPGINLEEVE